MKNQTHTAGPWKIDRLGSRILISAPGQSFIADVYGTMDRPHNADANACLIAAAPLLLEALQRIADRVKYHAGGEAPFSLESIGNEARAAIAAAQGEKEVA